MAFGNALQALMSKPGGAPMPPPQQAATQGIGQPPTLPDLPPAPTGMGAMPVGNPGIDKKGAIDQAILALRDVSGHTPSLVPQIQGLIDQLKSQAQTKAPGPDVSKPGTASLQQSLTSPTMESGSPGAM